MEGDRDGGNLPAVKGCGPCRLASVRQASAEIVCTFLGKGEYPILSASLFLTLGQLTSCWPPFSQREQNRSQEGRGRTVLHSRTGTA